MDDSTPDPGAVQYRSPFDAQLPAYSIRFRIAAKSLIPDTGPWAHPVLGTDTRVR
jgi:hypothetical protein